MHVPGSSQAAHSPGPPDMASSQKAAEDSPGSPDMASSQKAAEDSPGSPDMASSQVAVRKISVGPRTIGPVSLRRLRKYLGIDDNTDPPSQSTPLYDPIFIAVDVEAWERDATKVTEVGIAVVDSRALLSTPATPLDWINQIRTQHIIIKEHQSHVNSRFVRGCPDKFQFGQSKIVALDGMSGVFKSFFVQPDESAPQSGEDSLRNVVLVGHAVAGDIKWMEKLGYPCASMSQLVGLVDTQRLARDLMLPQSLSKLAAALGEEPQYLHNAGNDAHWTMQSVLLFALYGSKFPNPPSMAIARQELIKRIQAHKERMRMYQEEAKVFQEANEGKGTTKIRKVSVK
ncbi:qde-2-interacting protein [Diplodia corticola]|uniref:Qde-2-interacting protein n=1 Tax=Diplodia corticola TaxID=236234 RepID=A0A1J9RCV6_9PEZI|nr:qde-2-interacting protein [Diplodia corticola]OJD30347.1 qde-2-interacting protein [Diplodia corticola]